ncbi:flavoprotein [Bacillus sinesaloumensis]|uniref:flavoprotein n=1 Tax=Litchfieldia sinesaloumensis TaxID=1926280 RepID=UPI0009887036|nr:flavoprotein [Bacillus sinesaloumensis]
MDHHFKTFLDSYLDAWTNSSLTEMRGFISNQYKGREISGNDIVDFGFEESIKGWEQGFKFVREHNAKWELNLISVNPLRVDEVLVIISASMIINGEPLHSANLFFQTFKKVSSIQWKLVRSYIEAGIPKENINKMQLN